jgi:hypothetical protein
MKLIKLAVALLCLIIGGLICGTTFGFPPA